MKATVAFIMVTATLLAPCVFAAESPLEDAFLTQQYLTGDWRGSRSRLTEQGITFNLEYTSTYQGPVQGVENKDFDYGGQFDGFINFDSRKLGLWDGGGFHMHAEYNHGKPVVGLGDSRLNGVFFPVNTAQVLPLGRSEELEFTSLYFSQQIGEQGKVLFGKINVIDLLASDLFFGGWGIRRFMNVAFVAPPSGVLPPTIFGAIANFETDSVNWTFKVYDPNDRTSDYFPDALFSDGVNIAISGALPGKLMGRKTRASVDATYSTKEGTDLSDVLLPELEPGTKKGSYSVSFQFSHHLQESRYNPDDAWGVFLKLSVADGNPNPIDASVVGGIGGKALFVGRPQDSFGLGYFYYAFSNELRNALEPTTDLDDEQGVEMFYSYEVTPWFHITADIQYIDPASVSDDNVLIAGLRTNIRF
ncbi:MAG: hypothetical protein DRR42_16780 [Gammaproteobacteria bacterium]|nr:MAG: hypothetical protein DRR42_16780 [Gammaproteobacteria bacterium]